MALEYDGHRIGAMQYNGVTIGEAMIDGVVVYRADTGPDPASGSWGPTSVSGTEVMATYTITHDGEYLLEHTVTGGNVVTSRIIHRNGESVGSALGASATATYTGPLQAGDVIEFRVSQTIGAVTLSGSWSITPTGASVIRVTPVAPTFHDGEPWYTLPTVEGITYSVSGTPGYDASVTVTATADEGYELVGTASWSHTYGPAPSIYPLDGGWGPAALDPSKILVLDTHTIAETGDYSITQTVTGGGTWVESIIRGPWGYEYGNLGPPSTISTSRNLAAGSLIEFMAGCLTSSGTASGSWSIVKN